MIKAYKFGLAVNDEIDDNTLDIQLSSKTSSILNDFGGKYLYLNKDRKFHNVWTKLLKNDNENFSKGFCS